MQDIHCQSIMLLHKLKEGSIVMHFEVQDLIGDAVSHSQVLGIKMETMTLYRTELVLLKSDGYTNKKIALILSEKLQDHEVSKSNVQSWFTKKAQPRDAVIAALECMLFERLNAMNSKLKHPVWVVE